MSTHITQHEGYDIKPHKDTPNNYIVVTSGRGGKIPACLEGLFTSRAVAKDKIDTYLRSKVKE